MPPIKDSGLRIGELAKLAGTTPRAIRHYHSLGLLGEPERDESGYRRYGPQHLVRLVHIRRLRSLDMPLDEIAANLGAQPADVDIAGALRSLARDIEQQIQRLAGLRARVLDIAASGSLSDPAATWEAALRQRGILDQSVELPPTEQSAAQLIDALHPNGIQGVIDQTAYLAADPALRQRRGCSGTVCLQPSSAAFSASASSSNGGQADAHNLDARRGDHAPVDPRTSSHAPSLAAVGLRRPCPRRAARRARGPSRPDASLRSRASRSDGRQRRRAHPRTRK
ncbi:MAG: MerR family transcriptional regulator [Solirubrobacteraceae bacterium]